MKSVKWKILVLTSCVCLAAIIPGLVLRQRLPETIAIHFDLYNNPDGYASKPFAILGLPFIMAAIQVLLCIWHDLKGNVKTSKISESVVKWTIPVVTVTIQLITLIYALGVSIDVRIAAGLIAVGVIVVTAACMPRRKG